MSKKHLIIIFYLCSMFITVDALRAQSVSGTPINKESINKIFGEKDQEKKLVLLLNFSEEIANKGYYNLALSFTKDAFRIAEKLKPVENAKIHVTIGRIYYSKGDYATSLKSLLEAKKIYERFNNKTGMAQCYNNMASIYHSIGKIATSETYLWKAIEIYGETKDYQNMAKSYANLGLVYEAKEVKKAIEFATKAKELASKSKDTSTLMMISLNLGRYNYLIHDYHKADWHYQKAISLVGSDNEKLMNIHLYWSKFLFDHDQNKALLDVEKGIQIAQNSNNKVALAGFYILIGTQYAKEDIEKSIHYFIDAYDLAKEIDNPDLIYQTSQMLNENYLSIKDYKNAYKYLKICTSHDNMVNHQKIQEIDLVNELTRKNKEIELIQLNNKFKESENKKEKNAILSLASILMLITLYFSFRQRTKSLKNAKVLLDKEVKKQTESLERANHIQSMLTTTLVHDLKSPLIFLSRVAKRINQNTEVLSKNELKEMSAELRNHSENLVMFIDEFVIWTKTKNLNFKPNFDVIDVSEVIEPMRIFYSEIIAKNGNVLKIDLPHVHLRTDKQLLQIIIRNLLDNANKYTSHGTIELKSFNLGDKTLIVIEDTGSGMTQDQIQNLLIEEEGTTNFTNGQLGYKFIREFTGILNCQIEIESAGKDKGSKVTLTFSNH